MNQSTRIKNMKMLFLNKKTSINTNKKEIKILYLWQLD